MKLLLYKKISIKKKKICFVLASRSKLENTGSYLYNISFKKFGSTSINLERIYRTGSATLAVTTQDQQRTLIFPPKSYCSCYKLPFQDPGQGRRGSACSPSDRAPHRPNHKPILYYFKGTATR